VALDGPGEAEAAVVGAGGVATVDVDQSVGATAGWSSDTRWSTARPTPSTSSLRTDEMPAVPLRRATSSRGTRVAARASSVSDEEEPSSTATSQRSRSKACSATSSLRLGATALIARS
jgi:hypothetical protein